MHILTSNRNTLARLFPTSEKNHILLRSIDIVILQEEDFIDSIVLKSRELDEYSDGPCK